MAKFTIELIDSHVVSSRNVNVAIDISKLSPEIVAKLVLHGLTQKVGDSAASALKDAGFSGTAFKDLTEAEQATVATKAREAMEATRDQIMAGEWTTRVAGGASVDPLTARIRKLFGAVLRAEAKAVWAEIKDLEYAERGEELDKLFATQDDDYREAMEAAAKAELAAEAKTKAGVSKLQLKINA